MNGRASASCTRRATLSAASDRGYTGQHQAELVAAGTRDTILDDAGRRRGRRVELHPVAVPQAVLQSIGDFLQHVHRRPPGPCVSLMREKLSTSSMSVATPLCRSIAHST